VLILLTMHCEWPQTHIKTLESFSGQKTRVSRHFTYSVKQFSSQSTCAAVSYGDPEPIWPEDTSSTHCPIHYSSPYRDSHVYPQEIPTRGSKRPSAALPGLKASAEEG
jgi:hypothetical protein